jgi:ABC-2 type transport system permease protein
MIITKGAIPLGWNFLFFVISLTMALIINFNIDMLVAPICLYTESTWGINMVKETIVLLLSGATIPLAFFPDSIRRVVEYMPFRAVYDMPLTILLNKDGANTMNGLLSMLGTQLIWCIVLTIAGNLFWNHAVKRITVNGG